MSGPALKQLNAHRAIHDAAFEEAAELTLAARNFAEAGQVRAAIATVRLLVEHWQTRTLRHATEEEEGFYREVLNQDPSKTQDIAALTRDHDLMRLLLCEVEALLVEAGAFHTMIDRLQMLLWLVVAHSREEEHRLLGFEDLHEGHRDVAPGVDTPNADAERAPDRSVDSRGMDAHAAD